MALHPVSRLKMYSNLFSFPHKPSWHTALVWSAAYSAISNFCEKFDLIWLTSKCKTSMCNTTQLEHFLQKLDKKKKNSSYILNRLQIPKTACTIQSSCNSWTHETKLKRIMGASNSLSEKPPVTHLLKNLPIFYGISFPYWEEPFTDPHPQPEQSSPYYHILSL